MSDEVEFGLALAESKEYRDAYYTTDFTEKQLRVWVAIGSPAQCIEAIRAHVDAGATIITLRFTARDPAGQLRRFIDEVYPAFARPAADRPAGR